MLVARKKCEITRKTRYFENHSAVTSYSQVFFFFKHGTRLRMSIFEGNYNNNYTNENESKVSLLNWNCNIRYSILLSLYMMLTTMSIWVLNYYKITFICAMFISGPYKCGWTRITDVFQRNRFLVPLPDLKENTFLV